MDKLTAGELSDERPVGDLVRWVQTSKDLLKTSQRDGGKEGRKEGSKRYA